MMVLFSGANELELVASVSGPRDGSPVLMLHGGGQTRHAWGRAAKELARNGFLAVSIDMRGHGASGWSPDGNYHMDVYADDVRAVCAQLGRPTALVGASLGGLAAMLAAGESPQADCTALVLVDVTPRMSEEGRQEVLSFMGAHAEGFSSLEEAAEAVSRYLPHRKKPSSPEGLSKNLRRGEGGRLYWHWDPAFITRRRVGVEDADPQRLEQAVLRAAVPTLLVRGGVSDLVSSAHADEFRAAVPHAEYVSVPGAAHMVAGDSNDVFVASVVEFLIRANSQELSTGGRPEWSGPTAR